MEAARGAADALLNDATVKVRERVCVNGRPDAGTVDREQRATHGLAWFATYVEAIRQLASYTDRMSRDGRLGEIEELLVRIGAGEFLAQMAGGILMSQGELVRPADLGLSARAVAARFTAPVEELIETGNTAENRARLIALMNGHAGATVGDCGLDDILDSMREEMRKFADSEVVPHAQGWHRTNSYIPLEVISKMAELGVFGLTIPENLRRPGPRQGIHVRGLRGALARLYRSGLDRHPLGNRGGIDSRQRHRGTEGAMAAEARLRRGAADRGVHRAQHRLGPRLLAHPRGARRRRVQSLRQQDLDHPSGSCRPDDAAGAHRPEPARLPRPLHAACRKAARQRRRSVSGPRHVRHRNRGARLSWHEGIRNRL